MNIQKKFEIFLKEDTADAGQAYGRALVGAPPGVPAVDDVVGAGFNIEDPDTVHRLNAYLSHAGTPVMNPYFLIKRIQDKLMQVGLHFDVPTLVGNSGEVSVPLSQFGGTYGYKPTSGQANGVGYPEVSSTDGISDRVPGGLNIKFDWTCFRGLYTIGTEIVPGTKPVAKAIKEGPLKEAETLPFKPGKSGGFEVKSAKAQHPKHNLANTMKEDENPKTFGVPGGVDKLKDRLNVKANAPECAICHKFHFDGEACPIEEDFIDPEKKVNEVSPPGWSGTTKAMKKHKEITNPFALSWWMKNKGDHPHYKPEKK